MGLTRFPSGIASFGVPVLPGALEVTTGKVFFVHHSGSNGNSGTDTGNPFADIDYAVGQCTANKGDTIYVMPGHAETVAAAGGITVDVAGVSIIGLGRGAARPTLTMSAVASSFLLSAASCLVRNLFFNVQHDCTVVVDVDAADCVIDGCEIRSRTAATAREFVVGIDINGGAANACDRTTVSNCYIASPTAGATGGIELGEVADRVVISGCTIIGDYGDAAIHNPTGKVLTKLSVSNCFLENTQTGDHAIELVSACTGWLEYNRYKTDMTQQTGADPGSCFSFECYQDDAIDTSGILTPVIT